MQRIWCVLLATTSGLCLTSAVSGVTIEASLRGHYRSDGNHSVTVFNTLTGFLSPNTYRSFFVFDLDGYAGTVDDAVLRLELENYTALDASQTFDVFDVSTPFAQLDTPYTSGSSAGQAIYADLGTGNLYATRSVVAANVGSILEIPLSSQAFADIESQLGGTFAVGLALRSPFTGSNDFIRFSGGTGAGTHQLQLTLIEPAPEPGPTPQPAGLPEPATGVLLSSCAAAWLVLRRRRQV